MILKTTEENIKKYNFQLTSPQKTMEELEFALVQFRDDPDRHCVVKEEWGNKYAVYTTGEMIEKDCNKARLKKNREHKGGVE